MCGISGLFSVARLDPATERVGLDRMQRALQHRGPDGSGMKIFGHAALVHNRLAIIDLKTGEQPLMNPAGDICIVFNGEIYNYREMKALYSQYPFRTQSDTEVIIAAYAIDGVAGFGKLRGMYAFSIWDERKKTGLLVRDPVGIKPLFYSQNNGRLLFGSEAKVILAQGDTAVLDTGALHHLMNFRYVVGNSSLFQGIRQVPPGTVIAWQQGECIQSTVEQAQIDLPSTLSEVMQLAVERHLVADVPVGAFLSGGLDSSSIVAMAREVNPDIHCFTIESAGGQEEGSTDDSMVKQ